MLTLDPHTYGNSPAAMYLTLYLNEQGSESLNRKVGRKLETWRQTIKDVAMSHMHTDEMSPATFGKLLIMMTAAVRESALVLPDKLCQELVTNILVGELKTWKTRCINTSRLQRRVKPVHGEPTPIMRVMPRAGEETDEERIEKLRERSRRYLERHGKKNTLY